AGAGTPVTTVRAGPGYSAADVVPSRTTEESAALAKNGEGGAAGPSEASGTRNTGSAVPPHLLSGQAAEAEQLAALGSTGKVPFTPTLEQANSAAFKVIVGEPKFTKSGDLVGTIYDGKPATGGLAELKNGSSTLDSSYQLRLQTYGALINDTPLTIYTGRPVNSTFSQWLKNWGVDVKPLPR
ncbi:hypothetical protein, partial [Ralstonia solanacearum]